MALLARLLRYGGGKLLDGAVARVVSPAKAPRGIPSPVKAIGGAALMRVATRSVPGAILVGGGLLAKMLYDRRRAGRAPQPGTQHEFDEDGKHFVG